MKAALSAVHQR